MKNLSKLLLIILIFTGIGIISCQKELDFETVVSPASGTLKSDSTGDCLPQSIHGDYTADSALNSTNYIDLQVMVSFPGEYNISSDSVNGIRFKGNGVFGATGLNNVRLYGNGTPRDSGTYTFRVTYDTSHCFIDIDFAKGDTLATFTLDGAGGTCTGLMLNGTYTAGVAMDQTNTAALSVNVTAPGSYFISTPDVNGVTFAATGFFTAAGPQTVTLQAVGTPLAAGPFNYPINGASGGSCAFSVVYQ